MYEGHVITVSCGCVWDCGCGWMCGFYSQLRALFTYFGQLLSAHKRIVNVMKVYINRNNIQVELIRFRTISDFIDI